MLSLQRKDTSKDRSFLPEDYVERRSERRTNLLSLTLFTVVTVGVVGAFLVTNRQWNDVRLYQEAINVRYSQAAREIDQLKALEQQKQDLLKKAELTTALIERVPRSIMLAELINRMPTDMTILELEVKSNRLQDVRAVAPVAAKPKAGKSLADGKAARTDAAAQPEERPDTIAPPRYETTVGLVGVASSHNSVAKFVASLQGCDLLDNVELRFSELTNIQDRELNRFRIEAMIRSNADARRMDPLEAPRLRDIPRAPALTPADAAEAEAAVSDLSSEEN